MRRVLALLLTAMLVSGCWDREEPEHIAWVSAIGVDTVGEEDFVFTFHLIVPRAAIGTGGQGGGGGPRPGQNFLVYSVRAPDLATAMITTDSFLARRLSLTHSKALVIGEELARKGVAPIMAAANRFPEFRRTTHVLIAKGTAKEFLRLAQPRVEADPSLYFELLMMWQEETQSVGVVRFHEFIQEMERPGIGARAGIVAPRTDVETGEADPFEREVLPSPGHATAGEISRSGGAPVDFMGRAIFKGDRMIGALTGVENRILAAVRGELRTTIWSVPDPERPERRVVLSVGLQRKTRLQVERRGGPVHVGMRIAFDAHLVSVTSLINYVEPEKMERLERSVEAHMRREIEKLVARLWREWEVDPFHVTSRVMGTFPTLQDWERFDWPERISRTSYDVQVQVNVRRHGLQVEPAVPRR